MKRMTAKKEKSFTLLELVTVLCLTCLLGVQLLAVLPDSQKEAMAVQCIGNMKLMGMGTAMYVADHGTFPNHGFGPAGCWAGTYYTQKIGTYLGYEPTLWKDPLKGFDPNLAIPPFRCPADRSGCEAKSPIAGRDGISYGMNNSMSLANPLNIKRPDDTVLFVEGIPSQAWFTYGNLRFFHDGPGKLPGAPSNGAPWNGSLPPDGGMNMTWADGHVTTVREIPCCGYNERTPWYYRWEFTAKK